MATTLRSIRIDDLVWARWQAAALTEGISLSDWIRKAADRALAEPDAGVVAENLDPVGGRAQKPAGGDSRTNPRATESGSASAPVERRDLTGGARPDFKPERKKK